MRVLYAEAVYGTEEIEAVLNVLQNQSHSLMTSENVFKLEQEVAKLFGHKYGVMVNSGSSANLIALQSLELPAKSEVITPALTFATTLAPIIQSNLIPSFVDCKKDSFNIDVDLIEESITPRTKAMMIPNLIGNLSNLPEIKKLADKFNLVLIEDSADTIGHKISDSKTGIYSHISTTSFYASHIITGAGFGGMVTTSNEEFLKNCQLLRGWGRNSSTINETEDINLRTNVILDGVRYDSKFIFSKLGYNFLPSEISAAFALVQLKKLNENITQRVLNFEKLQGIFGRYRELFFTPIKLTESVSPWLAYPFTVKETANFTRSELQIYLENAGIQTRTIFTGNALRHPAFSNVESVVNSKGYPESDRVMKNGLLIGLHNGLKDEHFEYIESILAQFIASKQ